VIPHGAVGKERYQIEKPQFRPPAQGDEAHDPEANIGNEWNEMCKSKPQAQDAFSITSQGRWSTYIEQIGIFGFLKPNSFPPCNEIVEREGIGCVKHFKCCCNGGQFELLRGTTPG
jgi:hypothetical protein